ncbi:MAG: DUF4263 domain-containing protein [Oligoflexia bacterium]|nr:DUF4263 domain-containing protein [Oligoflexia bacterium]
MDKKINIRSTSSSSASADDIILRRTETTQLIFRPMIVKNTNDPEASVKGQFIFQKKKKSGKWEDYNSLPLSKLKDGEWVKLELKSAEIKKLLDHLPLLKNLFKQYGIPWGESHFHITTDNISSVISQLSQLENKKIIMQELNRLQPDDLKNLSKNLFLALQIRKRKLAIDQFEEKLEQNLIEPEWQKWFKENSWVLGTEFVEILDERMIDTQNITDYLMKAYDGFLDIVEIKRPKGSLSFWANKKDHENLVPSMHLVRAITQSTKYIYEVEREANSVKFLERTKGIKTIKPRCILIFGRSNNWTIEHREAYRILNSSYHNLTIMTYDHVLDRAKRILGA